MSMGIGEKQKLTTWADTVLLRMKEELDGMVEAQSLVIPAEPGGWWHQYVCPVHHTELLFNPLERDAHTFVCPHGCRINEEVYRGAWLVFKHQSLARAALQSAAVYAGLREPSYAELAKRLLVEYARQFPRYPVHPDAQPWMLKGRAFHQALTEAIWSTTLLRACLLLQDEGVEFTEDERTALNEFVSMLESSMTEYRHILIYERKNPENNYTAWLNASLSCVYAVQGNKEALAGLIEGEGGWKHHLSIGVKRDQLEFEGSVYYHIFVLRAYLITAEMAERFGMDLYAEQGSEGQSMAGMFGVLAALADDTGVLPALHDGPVERLPYAREIAEIMEIGLAKYNKRELIPLLAEAYRQMGSETGERSELEALLYGEGGYFVSLSAVQQRDKRASCLLPDSGFVVGRHEGNALSFLADFGPHGGSHGHYDKLHLSIMHKSGAWTPDFGMVPYGSTLRKQWFAETASHNTVSIDGMSQAKHEGRCVSFAETAAATSVWLQSDAAYPGCRLDRRLLLTEGWLLDWFEVRLDRNASVEWWMHPVMEPEQAPSVSIGEAKGTYPLRIEDAMRELPIIGRYEEAGESGTAQQLAFVYPQHDGSKLYHTALLLPEQEAFAVRTPGTTVDPSSPLTALLHRQTGERCRFVHVYSVSGPIRVELHGEDELRLACGSEVTICKLKDEQGLTIG
ncbi:heparinase II/III family protein [Paenibacillus allorhizosphaerae]|uniref:Alginate lyase family protein n=1 Tax=Paenibacillus allorhizosphaerae TaxID=2849866 RepID=A0ABM8VCH5_9BACL|nr:heparinase II/III family protein [Paenibacillus allorhizosphaerae]CAG7622217.1 hypothetical protein PAECIP111802_00802 [Paenibacillus allorhizosphaerae]